MDPARAAAEAAEARLAGKPAAKAWNFAEEVQDAPGREFCTISSDL